MTFGMHPRTVNFPTPDIRKMYGEDLSAELYQRMQAGHQTSRTLAGEFMKTAGEKSKMDHDKKAFPRAFKNGDLILLEEKNFKNKNAKLAEKYKGPYIIVKMNDENKTAIIKKPHGVKEMLYNTDMFKKYLQPKNEKEQAKNDQQNIPKPPLDKEKKVPNLKTEGGPTTRSKSKLLGPVEASYAAKVKTDQKLGNNDKCKNFIAGSDKKQNQKLGNTVSCQTEEKQNQKLGNTVSHQTEAQDEIKKISTANQSQAIGNENMLKKDAQTNATFDALDTIEKRLQKARRTRDDILKLNLKQWTSLKASIDKETQKWKNCIIARDWGPGHI